MNAARLNLTSMSFAPPEINGGVGAAVPWPIGRELNLKFIIVQITKEN